jgi:hypothetical protein
VSLPCGTLNAVLFTELALHAFWRLVPRCCYGYGHARPISACIRCSGPLRVTVAISILITSFQPTCLVLSPSGSGIRLGFRRNWTDWDGNTCCCSYSLQVRRTSSPAGFWLFTTNALPWIWLLPCYVGLTLSLAGLESRACFCSSIFKKLQTFLRASVIEFLFYEETRFPFLLFFTDVSARVPCDDWAVGRFLKWVMRYPRTSFRYWRSCFRRWVCCGCVIILFRGSWLGIKENLA